MVTVSETIIGEEDGEEDIEGEAGRGGKVREDECTPQKSIPSSTQRGSDEVKKVSEGGIIPSGSEMDRRGVATLKEISGLIGLIGFTIEIYGTSRWGEVSQDVVPEVSSSKQE